MTCPLQEQQGDQQMQVDNLQQGLLGLQEGLEQLVNLGQDLQHLPALQVLVMPVINKREIPSVTCFLVGKVGIQQSQSCPAQSNRSYSY